MSYPRGGTTSVNYNTPESICKVKYPDFNEAIQLCIKAGKNCKIAKSDMTSAFRNLGIMRRHWRYLIMIAKSPFDGKWYQFADKCLPFGASISCAIFQKFSNCVAHIVKYLSQGKRNVNYLDDFLFVALLQYLCNHQMRTFLKVCEMINFPVSPEKTFWATERLVFLGMLIDTIKQCVSIPVDKLKKGVELIETVMSKQKMTVRQMQKFCGFLNFLGKGIVPGRAFTRRMYAYTGNNMKPHHHIRVNKEIKSDLNTWLIFLKHPQAFCRPFIDFSADLIADRSNMYTDASGAIGLGGICQKSWMHQVWSKKFLAVCKPSIEYLELFAVVAGVLAWIHRFRNRRVILFCDNQSVCSMINHTTSSCKNCMVLVRALVLKSLLENVRVFAHYVKSSENIFADSLSRNKIKIFKNFGGNAFEPDPTPVPDNIWPPEKIWVF